MNKLSKAYDIVKIFLTMYIGTKQEHRQVVYLTNYLNLSITD